MKELDRIKSKFIIVEKGYIDLNNYGQFSYGLTQEEIKDYLRVRANKMNINVLYKKFLKIAGVNTMALVTCPECKKSISLLYRHDAKRFADVLFGVTKDTYFD